VPEVGRHALPGVEDQLRAQGIASAWRLLPDLHLGIVVLPRAEQLQKLVAVLIRDARQPVGVSPLYAGLDRTAEALRLAKIALAGTTSSTALVTVFDDAPLAVAAASAPEVMARIAQTILGSLNQMPDADRTLLLETFEVWRDAGGSAEAAGRRLFCHPNTVRHRLRRLSEATGRSLSAPQDVAELCLAVEAARQQPPAPEQG
jgi:DNA-binding PucR family transcriptional regulator